MATWADIQSWELSYVEEAEDLIEAEVREPGCGYPRVGVRGRGRAS